MQATIHSQHKAYTNQITRPDLSTEWKWKALSHLQLFVTSWTTQSMEFIRPKYWNGVAFPFSRGYSQPRDPTQVSHIAGGFFTSWDTQKPKNAGVGNLSLLQQIFLTQELNRVSCIAGECPTNWPIRISINMWQRIFQKILAVVFHQVIVSHLVSKHLWWHNSNEMCFLTLTDTCVSIYLCHLLALDFGLK